MNDLGIKLITVENWLEVDYVSAKLIGDNVGVQKRQIEASDLYIESIVQYNLTENVPIEIRRIFEVAKGAMAYGYFFYPLFAVGFEHICKVAEATIRIKCKMVDAPPEVGKNFMNGIEWLVKYKYIS